MAGLRHRCWWLPVSMLALPFVVLAETFSVPARIAPDNGNNHAGIEILGAVQLARKAPDGSPVTGLSGLAWDADEQRLYAVSDRGRLLHMLPRFEDGDLVAVSFLEGYPLLDAKQRDLRGARRDAEGLALRNGDNGIAGDSELWISFERHPRIQRYSPDGRLLATEKLPGELGNPDRYATPNKALESLSRHPVYGLITASELPMVNDPPGTVSLYALAGGRWRYPLGPASGSSLVALEALADGRLVALERAFVSPFAPLIISLRVVALEDNEGLDVRTLARLDTSQGWRLDNFEGLARHEDDRFFMISDDNTSTSQRTLLVYLRLPGLSDGGLEASSD